MDHILTAADTEFLKWAEAERKRLAKYGFNLDGTRIQAPDGPETT